ncbi:MAG: HD domain-containing protein [Clostridia bacterium]|nr:HD domain-containing protein [Clostridia bacterium]
MATTKEKELNQMVLSLAAKYAYDEKHANFVQIASLKIFDSLRHIHSYGNSERLLLSHAALLHDIGSFINDEKHNKHTLYIITRDENLAEYPEEERRLVSLIAYNHRKRVHRDTLSLSKKDKDMVLKLSSILRVADALDYTREDAAIKDISIVNSDVRITIDEVLPEKLNERLNRKKELFVDVFGLDISLHI